MESLKYIAYQIACRSAKKLKKSLVVSRPTPKAARDFYFMATVLERFNHLGLAHNNKILMIVGVEVSNAFYWKYGVSGYRIRCSQKEGDEVFQVWDYPESFIKDMDHCIINFLNHYLEKNGKAA